MGNYKDYRGLCRGYIRIIGAIKRIYKGWGIIGLIQGFYWAYYIRVSQHDMGLGLRIYVRFGSAGT